MILRDSCVEPYCFHHAVFGFIWFQSLTLLFVDRNKSPNRISRVLKLFSPKKSPELDRQRSRFVFPGNLFRVSRQLLCCLLSSFVVLEWRKLEPLVHQVFHSKKQKETDGSVAHSLTELWQKDKTVNTIFPVRHFDLMQRASWKM